MKTFVWLCHFMMLIIMALSGALFVIGSIVFDGKILISLYISLMLLFIGLIVSSIILDKIEENIEVKTKNYETEETRIK